MLDTTYMFDGTLSSAGVPTGVAITTTRVSTNVLDLLAAVDMGAMEQIGIHVEIMAALTGGTSLQIDAEVSATAGGSYVQILNSPVYPAAQLIAGARIFQYALPVNQLLNATAGVLAKPGRFLRLNYTVVGTFGAGSVLAFLNPRLDRNEFYVYPGNYTVAVAAGEI